jgi:hypothetical protein
MFGESEPMTRVEGFEGEVRVVKEKLSSIFGGD